MCQWCCVSPDYIFFLCFIGLLLFWAIILCFNCAVSLLIIICFMFDWSSVGLGYHFMLQWFCVSPGYHFMFHWSFFSPDFFIVWFASLLSLLIIIVLCFTGILLVQIIIWCFNGIVSLMIIICKFQWYFVSPDYILCFACLSVLPYLSWFTFMFKVALEFVLSCFMDVLLSTVIVVDCTFVRFNLHIGLLYTVNLLICVNEW